MLNRVDMLRAYIPTYDVLVPAVTLPGSSRVVGSSENKQFVSSMDDTRGTAQVAGIGVQSIVTNLCVISSVIYHRVVTQGYLICLSN